MSHSAAKLAETLISGFPAELASVALQPASVSLDGQEHGAEQRTLSLYRVARPDELIDRDALLRDERVPDPPYWAIVWIGARAIAARMLEHPPAASSRVLDLGCGLGLSGIAAALGGCSITFADRVDAALAFARASAEHHRLIGQRFRRLDFSTGRLGERFDLILAADIVYDPEHYARLVEFLDCHLAPCGSILLTESLRADARCTIAMLAERGFTDEVEAVWLDDEGRRERTWLHTLRRAGR